MSNSSFTKVSNQAGQVDQLSVGSLSVGELNVTAANSVSIGNYTRNTVVGYAAAGFDALGAGSAVALVDAPGTAVAADSSNAIFIPNGSLVELIQVSNNGVPLVSVGAPTFDISTSTSALVPAAVTDYVSAATLATVNSGRAIASLTAAGAVGAMTPLAYSALGALPADGENYLAVTSAVAALTDGQLKVTITYLSPA